MDKNKSNELDRWNLMKSKGKGNYLIKDGILNWGIPTGILWAVFFQLIEDGLSLNSYLQIDFVRRIVIGIITFSLVGIVAALFKWNKLEKKYQNN